MRTAKCPNCHKERPLEEYTALLICVPCQVQMKEVKEDVKIQS